MNSAPQLLRQAARRTVERVLVTAPRRTKAGDRLILSYHNVVPDHTPPLGDRSLHLSAERFAEQLAVVKREADVVPLMTLLTEPSRTARQVAITFDDAYASALSLGVGRCVAEAMDCTVFVAPGLLGTVPVWDARAEAGRWSDADRHHFLWHEAGRSPGTDPLQVPSRLSQLARVATVTELLTAASSQRVSLGNHTMHHINLGALELPAAESEIRDCSTWLAALHGVQVIPVAAYPFGIAPKGPVPIDFGLLVQGGWLRDTASSQAVPRWNVPAGVSRRGFHARLRGWLA